MSTKAFRSIDFLRIIYFADRHTRWRGRRLCRCAGPAGRGRRRHIPAPQSERNDFPYNIQHLHSRASSVRRHIRKCRRDGDTRTHDEFVLRNTRIPSSSVWICDASIEIWGSLCGCAVLSCACSGS